MIFRWLFLFGCLGSGVSENIYNYYELAVQKWCSKEFMIHGLWPQIDREDYPVYCMEVDYVSPNGELLNNMNQYWKGCDDTLWEHEWEKHGSCIKQRDGIDEEYFFNKTIQLFLENSEQLINCNNESDNCIMGCFDLDYNSIPCE